VWEFEWAGKREVGDEVVDAANFDERYSESSESPQFH
jgi:hypothetical protein